MEFYEVVNSRRTIRDFEHAVIEDATIERILKAGLQAPSNDHMRDWHFIVIKDKHAIHKLIDIIPRGISDAAMAALIKDWNLSDPIQQACYKDAVPKQYRMFAEASCLVVPLFKQKTAVLGAENLSQLNGFASIWCCIENMLLAATDEQYACTLRIPLGQEEPWTRQLLNYPKDYLMPCLIAIGKPRPDAERVKQKEYSVQERIHLNQW